MTILDDIWHTLYIQSIFPLVQSYKQLLKKQIDSKNSLSQLSPYMTGAY